MFVDRDAAQTYWAWTSKPARTTELSVVNRTLALLLVEARTGNGAA
jgi:hypothetical protein